MLIFIVAVLFWPITLLYFFCIYIVPFLFKAFFVICSCVIYFATQNPGVSISLAVLAFIYLAISETKTKGGPQTINKPNKKNSASDLTLTKVIFIPPPSEDFIYPELSFNKSQGNEQKEMEFILENEMAQKVLFLFLKAPSKRCLLYPALSKIRPSFLKRNHTQAVSYLLTRELRPLSITHEFGLSEEQKNEIHHFHLSEGAEIKFSFKLKHIVDPSSGDLLCELFEIESYISGTWEYLVDKKFKKLKMDDEFSSTRREVVFASSFYEIPGQTKDSTECGNIQAIQLLKSLEPADRNKLLKNIEYRNPSLARELGQTHHYS